MKKQFPFWLTEEMIEGISGFSLDAFLLALEGWRRGLTLRWYYNPSLVTDLKVIGRDPLGSVFSLHSKQRTHFFQRSRGDRVHNRAVTIGTNKELSKEYFRKSDVNILEGRRFSSLSLQKEQVYQYAQMIDFPLVIKPTFGSLGENIKVNIKGINHFKREIKAIQKEGVDDVIVERYFPGNDFRVYVIKNQVIAAMKRIPANVVGDGQKTIHSLIIEKNKQRSKSPYFKTRLIPVNQSLKNYLQRNNYHLNSIPKTGERIFLTDIANVSMGGDPIDVTDQISPSIKRLAIRAVRSIPNLVHAGVDILSNHKDAVIIEVNPTAVISGHLFPMKGTPRNVPEAIIDYYFPKTKGLSLQHQHLYFDFNKINPLIRQGIVQELEVNNVSADQIYA